MYDASVMTKNVGIKLYQLH